jgi:hypothetical protein
MISYDSPAFWLAYYRNQAIQSGHGIDGFHGLAFQRGAGLGSFFRSLFRVAVPVLKQAAKATAKRVGRQAISAVGNIAADVSGGANFKDAFINRGKEAASNVLRESADALQSGNGLGYRPTGAATARIITKRKSKPKKKKASVKKKRRLVQSDIFGF